MDLDRTVPQRGDEDRGDRAADREGDVSLRDPLGGLDDAGPARDAGDAPVICVMCDETVTGDLAATIVHTETGPRRAHRACMLREVMGGIGHHIAHEYWCTQKGDPDAGLTRYQSARLVDEYISLMGVDEAVRRGTYGPGE